MTPAIVTEEDFNIVQKQLQINRKQKRGRAKHEFLLRGFVRCANCGRLFSPHLGGKSRRYVCTSTQLRTINCRTPTLNAEKAEQAVWREVLKILKSEKKLKTYIERRGKPKETKNDNRDKIVRIEKEIERLVSRMGVVDDKIWNVVQKELENRQKEIERLKREKIEQPAFDSESFRRALSSIDYNDLDFAGKVKLLKLFQLECFFDGETLDIKLGV
jgi:site-specific DNA recombinase